MPYEPLSPFGKFGTTLADNSCMKVQLVNKWMERARGLTGAAPCLVALFVLFIPVIGEAASTFSIDMGGNEVEQMSAALKMIAILTLIALGPTILLTMTSFVRIVVVLSLLKTALGTQTTPPQQVLMGLALFLTIAIMWPVGQTVYSRGVGPFMEGQIDGKEAIYQSMRPMRQFMLKQPREDDMRLFYDISETPHPDSPDEVGMHLLIPAYIISELRTAFEMGFLVFIPFLMLDMIVASITMSLGLVMLPPALISMPLKLMLFVLADDLVRSHSRPHLIIGCLRRLAMQGYTATQLLRLRCCAGAWPWLASGFYCSGSLAPSCWHYSWGCYA